MGAIANVLNNSHAACNAIEFFECKTEDSCLSFLCNTLEVSVGSMTLPSSVSLVAIA